MAVPYSDKFCTSGEDLTHKLQNQSNSRSHLIILKKTHMCYSGGGIAQTPGTVTTSGARPGSNVVEDL